MSSDLWYVETSLYSQEGELLDDVGSVVLRADNGREACFKAEKMVVNEMGFDADSVESGIAEPIEMYQLEELLAEFSGIIIEPGIIDPPTCKEVI
jgi:hypothetical protein